MTVLQFNINDVLLEKLKGSAVRNEPFLKLSLDEKLNKLVSLGFDVLVGMERSSNDTSKRLPRYEVSDKSILNQYRIDNTYNLNFSEIRQLTKLHKGILEQKLNGYSVINNFCFENVDLSNRDLHNIKLRQGNLRGGNFKNSNLTNCDFSKTMLWGADFTGADLENAKFDIAYLGKYQGKDTNFTGANLKGTILENN